MTKAQKYVKFLESEIRYASRKVQEYRKFWGENSTQEKIAQEAKFNYQLALATFKTIKGDK